jgi:hypothetical protein
MPLKIVVFISVWIHWMGSLFRWAVALLTFSLGSNLCLFKQYPIYSRNPTVSTDRNYLRFRFFAERNAKKRRRRTSGKPFPVAEKAQKYEGVEDPLLRAMTFVNPKPDTNRIARRTGPTPNSA